MITPLVDQILWPYLINIYLIQWVGTIDDLEAEFDAIDVNGGGQILFNEFVDWASQKNLDIEEDDDQNDDIYVKLQ